MSLLVKFLCAITLSYAFAVNAAEPSHVIVDPSDRHTTTFIGVPKALPEKQFEALKQSLRERQGAYIVTWQEFKESPEKHIRPNIKRNDYPAVDITAGMTQLLERFDGSVFGLTWNGGIAVTQNDFAHSARTFLVYNEPARDPVHPRNHLDPLLRK